VTTRQRVELRQRIAPDHVALLAGIVSRHFHQGAAAPVATKNRRPNAFRLTFEPDHSGRQVPLWLLQCTASVINGGVLSVEILDERNLVDVVGFHPWSQSRVVEAVAEMFEACRDADMNAPLGR
jgi:hypothetical protein